jgi:hypothetical protein
MALSMTSSITKLRKLKLSITPFRSNILVSIMQLGIKKLTKTPICFKILSMRRLGMMTLSLTTFSLTILSIIPLDIIAQHSNTLLNDTQHCDKKNNETQHNNT